MLSWIGLIVGVIALLLAVIALTRTVPAISWENTGPDLYTLWNQGPGPVVVRRAYIQDPAGERDVSPTRRRPEHESPAMSGFSDTKHKMVRTGSDIPSCGSRSECK